LDARDEPLRAEPFSMRLEQTQSDRDRDVRGKRDCDRPARLDEHRLGLLVFLRRRLRRQHQSFAGAVPPVIPAWKDGLRGSRYAALSGSDSSSANSSARPVARTILPTAATTHAVPKISATTARQSS